MTRFLPTASLRTLQHRAHLIAALRTFFTDAGYWECETPILSRDIVVDANLDPFTTTDHRGRTMYLQTSPEAGMKRLLAAGATSIFQVSRVMRKGEVGERHNPEFTMVEWYRAGDTHHDQMDFVERLVRHVCEEGSRLSGEVCDLETPFWRQPFERLTYDDAFKRHAGTRVLNLTVSQLAGLARAQGVSAPESLAPDDRDGWLNLLLAELVEPHLGRERPVFLHDYPASQAALAIIREEPDRPAVAERFELYVAGLELCNGYHELTDPEELARRTQRERAIRRAAGHADLPGASLLEQALQSGLPPCCGVALGLDRLIMTALNCFDIREVIPFPDDRC